MSKSIADIKADIEKSIRTGDKPGTEIKDFDWDALKSLVKDSDAAVKKFNQAHNIPGPTRGRAALASLGTDDFKKEIVEEIKKYVKELICKEGYEKIDTPEERMVIAGKLAEIVTDLIIAAYPSLLPARIVVKLLVKLIPAFALLEAAKGMASFCDSSKTFAVEY